MSALGPVEDPIYSKLNDAIAKMSKLLALTYYFDPHREYQTYFSMLRDDLIAASISLTRLTSDVGWSKILESKPEGDPMMIALFQAMDDIDKYGRFGARDLPVLTTQFVYSLYGKADIVKNILGILLNEYMEHKKIGNRLNSIGAETRAMEKKRHANINEGKNVNRDSWASVAMGPSKAQQNAPPLALKRNGTEFPGVITQPKQTFVEATQAFQRRANNVGMPLFNTPASSMGQDRQVLAASIINNDLRESMDNIRVLADRIGHYMEDVYIGVNTGNKDRAFRAISTVQHIISNVVSMIEDVTPQMTFIDNAGYLESLKEQSIRIEKEISQLFDVISKAQNSQNPYPEDIFEQINKIKSSARSMFSTWHRVVQEYETSIFNSIPLKSSGGYRKCRTHRKQRTNRHRKHKHTHRKHKRTHRQRK